MQRSARPNRQICRLGVGTTNILVFVKANVLTDVLDVDVVDGPYNADGEGLPRSRVGAFPCGVGGSIEWISGGLRRDALTSERLAPDHVPGCDDSNEAYHDGQITSNITRIEPTGRIGSWPAAD